MSRQQVTTLDILDGTVATVDLADLAVSNAKLAADAARMNLMTNGGFEIWQRGAGPFNSPGTTFSADRWAIYPANGDSTGPISVTRDGNNMDLGSGVCAAVTVTGAPTPGTPAALYQYPLHGSDGTGGWQLRGKYVAFSMRVRASLASAVRLLLSTNPPGAGNVYSAYHSGGGAYETLTAVIPIPTVPTGIVMTTQAVFEKAGTYYVDNAMLVPGSVPAEHVPLHVADDLARCNRYYEVVGEGSTGSLIVAGQASSAGQSMRTPVRFRARKAVAPTMTKVGTWLVSACATTEPSIQAPSVDGFFLNTVSTAAGDCYVYNNGGGAYMIVEANP